MISGPPTMTKDTTSLSAEIVEFPLGVQVFLIMQFGTGRPFDLNEGYDVLARGSGYSRPLIVNNDSPTDYLAYADSSLGGAARDCLAAGQCHQVGGRHRDGGMRSFNLTRASPRTSAWEKARTSNSCSKLSI